MKKCKISDLLVEKGLADNEKEALALIMAGKVVAAERRIDKPGTMIAEGVPIRVKVGSKFVSRAGDKLESAIKLFALEDEFKNCLAMDVGASTGGFTDCLLSYGARRVHTVDVGTNQLDWKIRNNPNVEVTEKTDFRKFKYPFETIAEGQILNWIVADVSFISLVTLVEAFKENSMKGTRLLLMVKPQFEIPKDLVPAGGVVEDEELIQSSVGRVCEEFEKSGFKKLGQALSGVQGKQGNQEVFLYLERI